MKKINVDMDKMDVYFERPDEYQVIIPAEFEIPQTLWNRYIKSLGRFSEIKDEVSAYLANKNIKKEKNANKQNIKAS